MPRSLNCQTTTGCACAVLYMTHYELYANKELSQLRTLHSKEHGKKQHVKGMLSAPHVYNTIITCSCANCAWALTHQQPKKVWHAFHVTCASLLPHLSGYSPSCWGYLAINHGKNERPWLMVAAVAVTWTLDELNIEAECRSKSKLHYNIMLIKCMRSCVWNHFKSMTELTCLFVCFSASYGFIVMLVVTQSWFTVI